MKRQILKSVILLLVVVVLASCSAKQEEMVIKSPKGNIELSFKANKPTSFDPFVVKMSIKGYEKERSLTFDMYNADFNSETVVVDWQDENKFILTFIQSDGDNRIMDVYLTADEIKLQERGGAELNLVNPLLDL